ncbi:hypothetical protein AB3S75_021848 [Citrus x aurantiifolia]
MTEKRKKKHETQEQASEKEWLKLSHMKRERELYSYYITQNGDGSQEPHTLCVAGAGELRDYEIKNAASSLHSDQIYQSSHSPSQSSYLTDFHTCS